MTHSSNDNISLVSNMMLSDLELAELHLQHVLAGGQTENSREQFGVGLHLKHNIMLLASSSR